MVTRDDLRQLVALANRQKALLDAGAGVLKANRAHLEAAVESGERIGDTATGFATMSNPADVVDVVDRGQLNTFLAAEGAGEVVQEIVNHAEVIEHLAAHAPHLLVEVHHIPEYAVTEAKARAKRGEAIPGIAVRPGRPSLSLRPSEDVKQWALTAMESGQLAVSDE